MRMVADVYANVMMLTKEADELVAAMFAICQTLMCSGQDEEVVMLSLVYCLATFWSVFLRILLPNTLVYVDTQFQQDDVCRFT